MNCSQPALFALGIFVMLAAGAQARSATLSSRSAGQQLLEPAVA